MILKNENDIYMYFETIEQLAPQRVLDIGMFLKRIGSVSRKVMDREVPAEVCLDGIDLFPQLQFPVWDTVYDVRVSLNRFLAEPKGNGYDLAVFLGMDAVLLELPLSQLAEALPLCTRYLLVDRFPQIWRECWSYALARDLKLEDSGYYLLDFGA
ncbi:MAG: hypothetical protein HFI84_03515 [Eubacterium sp.]|nr:hypothetical protein [Eubacterium sp.]